MLCEEERRCGRRAIKAKQRVPWHHRYFSGCAISMTVNAMERFNAMVKSSYGV